MKGRPNNKINKQHHEPHGKQNPKKLAQARQQQAKATEATLKKSKKLSDTRLSGPDGESAWTNYLTLLLLSGALIPVAGLAMMYVANGTSGVVVPRSEPATGSSRATGRVTEYYRAAPAATLFKEQRVEKPVVQPAPVPVQVPVRVEVPLPAKQPVAAKPERGAANLIRPLTSRLALFEAIHDLLFEKQTLSDLHQLIKRHGQQLLQAEVNMETIADIKVPENSWVFARVAGAHRIKPLHYAFLLKRWDAFALLLAEGAKIDDEFTAIIEDTTSHTKEMIATSLPALFYQPEKCYFFGDICHRTAMHEIFIAYLLRKDFAKVTEIMNHGIKRLQNIWRNSGSMMSIDEEMTKNIFVMLPTVQHLQVSLGQLNPGYREFMGDMLFEWAWLKNSVEKKYSGFNLYEPDARNAVLKRVEEYEKCFIWLYQNIDDHLKRDNYTQARVLRLQTLYKPFPKMDYYQVYFDQVRKSINDACTVRFNDAAPSSHLELIHFMLTHALTLTDIVDSQVYRESFLGVIRQQLGGYANQYQDQALLKIVEQMKVMEYRVEGVVRIPMLAIAMLHLETQLQLRSPVNRLGH